MVFDRTKRVVERHSKIQAAARVLERAKLFYGLSEATWDTQDPDFQRLVYEGFFLPFPHTGIILDGWCAFFEDPEERAKGPNVERFFVLSHLDQDGDLVIASGVLEKFSMSPEQGLRLDLRIGLSEIIVTKGNDVRCLRPELPIAQKIMPPDRVADLLTQAIAAVAVTNLPSHFIVEESDLPSAPPPPRGTSALPSQKRPRYTILTPGEIRTRIRRDPRIRTNADEGTRKVEYRRAHDRLLSHERWKNRRGATVHVKAVWNDAITWDDPEQHKRYRILLDR